MIIGIDPGLAGAFAFYQPESHTLDVCDMPVTSTTKGKGAVDLNGVARLLANPDWALMTRVIGVVEDVNAHATGSLTSAFNFGFGLGTIHMALTMAGAELHKVTPATWKKHHGLIFQKGTAPAQVKQASRALAQRVFPAYADRFKLVKHDGRAEAALIALFGAAKWG